MIPDKVEVQILYIAQAKITASPILPYRQKIMRLFCGSSVRGDMYWKKEALMLKLH